MCAVSDVLLIDSTIAYYIRLECENREIKTNNKNKNNKGTVKNFCKINSHRYA